MSSTISRTWYSSLVDDDGSGLVGTIWNKAAVSSLLDAVDALLTGILVIGAPALTTGSLEIQGVETALRLQGYSNTPGAENYIASFGPDIALNNRKQGALAFQRTDSSATSGYFSWNVHTTYITAGVSNDSYDLCVWAKHGAAFFPPDLSAASAPGQNVLRVNGEILLPNGNELQALNVGGVRVGMIRCNAITSGHIVVGHSPDYPACMVQSAAASINGGSAQMNGGLLWDTTNNWLVGYVNNLRYKFVGVAY